MSTKPGELHYDGSVTIVQSDGQRARFWKDGSTWTPAVHVRDTLAAATGGGYTLTRHSGIALSFDASGRLTAITDRAGNATTLVYSGTSTTPTTITAPGGRAFTITANGSGRITRIDGPAGLHSTYTYDTGGQLLTATDAAGGTTTYTYDGRHQLLTVVDGNGHTIESNTYGSLGRVTQQLDADGKATTFAPGWDSYGGTFAGTDNVTDPRGTVYSYTHDALSRPTQRDISRNNTLLQRMNWAYDARGNVTSVTDGDGRLTQITYDTRSNPLTVTTDAGTGGLALVSSATYSAANDVLTTTDPLNHTTTYTYDTAGNLLTATDALSHATTFTYNTAGQLTSVTDATSRTTSFGYNTAGDLTTITAPGSTVWTLAYDAAGRMTSVTDPLSHTTTLTYDGMGRVLTTTDALSHTTTAVYDAVGNRTSSTDALSHTTSYLYDVLDRLTRVTDAASGQTNYGYDATSNLTSVQNALGRTWAYVYDGLGRLSSATDPLGHSTSYALTAAGDVTQVTKPDSTVNRFVYDGAHRLTGVDLGNNSTLDITYAYDAASRRTSMTDGTGTTTYTYDNADRLSSAQAPTTGTVSYGYDNANRRTSLTYPGTGHQVSYGYNTRGELSSVTDWASRQTTYGYDAAGRLTGIATPNGVTSTLAYDIADRLTRITHANGSTTLEDIQYVLDSANRRTSMTDSAGTTSWTYDNLDRLTQATYPNSDVTGYGYDAAGNRTTLTQNGTTTTNCYDAANQLVGSGTAANCGTPGQTPIRVNVGGSTYTDGAGHTWVADTGYTGGNTASTGATISGTSDQPLYQTERWGTSSYAFPVLNGSYSVTLKFSEKAWNWAYARVFDVVAEGTTALYHFDIWASAGGKDTAVDRTFTVTVSDGVLNLDFQTFIDNASVSAIEIVPTTGGGGSGPIGLTTTYTYDANGNQTGRTASGTTTTYAYDALDRLTSVTGATAATSGTYTYNGDGLRSKKVVNGTTTNYAWDATGIGTVLSDGDEYLWGLGLIGRIDASGGQTYAHTDGLGSLRLLTNGSGTGVGTRQYDAFGAERAHTGITLPFGYTGEQQDTESGLMYLRARYMDSITGRFTRQDSLIGVPTLPRSEHRYSYAYNDPINLIDPSGLWTIGWCVTGTVAAGTRLSIQGCLVVTSHGQAGVTVTTSVTGSTSVGASVTTGPQVSNADSIKELGGASVTAGGSCGEGVTVGGDASHSSNGVRTVGLEGGFGAKVGLPFPPCEVHGGVSDTPITIVSPFYPGDPAYDKPQGTKAPGSPPC